MKSVAVRESQVQGKGVYALRDFSPGTLVLTIDDSHIVTDETQLTPEQHEFDLDYVAGKTILMQEPEKYINHSCDPNVYVRTRAGVRHVFALRKITRGDEITYDYAVNGDNDGTFLCHCGANICRGIYQGNFFLLPRERQRYYLPYLDGWFVEKYRDILTKLSEASP